MIGNRQLSSSRRGLSAEDARVVCDRVLGMSRADHTRVTIESGGRKFVRSAANRITTAGGSSDVTVEIMSVFGQKAASVTTNRLEAGELESAVGRSETLARLAPADPEYLAELGPQRYDPVDGYYASTRNLAPEALAAATAHALKGAAAAGVVAAGFIDARAGSRAIATSNGLFAHRSGTGVASTLTVRTPDGASSGWAGDEAADWGEIETARLTSAAVRKCLAWRQRTALDPGRYTVILEPTAVGMLMLRMIGAFDARPADEGRSFFSKPGGGNRVGERLFDPRVALTSDPAALNAEADPFADDGVPRSREVWVRDGILQNLAYSRFWAERQGVTAKPLPANLIMSGGTASLQEMIASTRRGVLITRFWYIRGLNPQIISHTGAHPRRHLSHRERPGEPTGQQLPVQPVAGGDASASRHAGASRPGRGDGEQLRGRAHRRPPPQGARVQPGERERGGVGRSPGGRGRGLGLEDWPRPPVARSASSSPPISFHNRYPCAGLSLS